MPRKETKRIKQRSYIVVRYYATASDSRPIAKET